MCFAFSRLFCAQDSKLANFKQHSTMVSRKLHDKEVEVERLSGEHAKLCGDIEKREMQMAEVGGTKFMTREGFKKFSVQLREKTHVYKKLKTELGELRAETVTLRAARRIHPKSASKCDSSRWCVCERAGRRLVSVGVLEDDRETNQTSRLGTAPSRSCAGASRTWTSS